MDEVDSTNTRLLEMAAQGCKAPFVLSARRQTAGRGRQGRAFFSQPGGLYMSLLLRPACPSEQFRTLTPAAAVAAAQAVEELTGIRVGIKWVNDLYYSGRKVCGILAEAKVGAVAVGIGINLWPPEGGWPPELADKAGALLAAPDEALRLALIPRISEGILSLWRDGAPAPDLLARYRARSILDGCAVSYSQDGQAHRGRVAGISEDFGLTVDEDGGRRVLTSGEVHIIGFHK
ncbi:MAG TPA: biotin--[acetyl-CoA-carboxylase] ligase [Candidatus Acidoferrum sp.]|nr:biotin--[acetyl-CoA-carboxylase] ligase [Candidatus Acidoferrum sp.]